MWHILIRTSAIEVPRKQLPKVGKGTQTEHPQGCFLLSHVCSQPCTASYEEIVGESNISESPIEAIEFPFRMCRLFISLRIYFND